MLSAQCTDKRVNIVTKKLFKKFRNPKQFAKANLHELEKMIYSTGFYHSKAKNIKNSAKIIVKKFRGRIPNSMQELLFLPGVARKTANVVLFHAFNKSEGIAVDTHVKRISNLLGFTSSSNPAIIEKDLMQLFPKSQWGKINMLLVKHGRKICIAGKPKCSDCFARKLCPSSSA